MDDMRDYAVVLVVLLMIALVGLWAMPRSYYADEIRDGRCVELRVTETFGGLRESIEVLRTHDSLGPCL